MNVIREIQRINQRELELNVLENASWHTQYSHSAYIFIAGLDPQLSEGDVICIFSQCGEVVDINLVRDKTTGKSRGFAFLAFEDQRSTVLAVDNLNGATVLRRVLRVDHADKYRRPRPSTPHIAASQEEADFLQFDGDEAVDYDERRKAIWDYEAYPPAQPMQAQAAAPVRVQGREGGVGSAPTSYSVDIKRLRVEDGSEDRNAVRILRLWEERQARKKQREEEEEEKKESQAALAQRNGRDGRRGAGAIARREAATETKEGREERVERDEKPRMEEDRSHMRERECDGHRSPRRRSRSRSRSPDHERRSRRSRDRERDRDRHRARDRSR